MKSPRLPTLEEFPRLRILLIRLIIQEGLHLLYDACPLKNRPSFFLEEPTFSRVLEKGPLGIVYLGVSCTFTSFFTLLEPLAFSSRASPLTGDRYSTYHSALSSNFHAISLQTVSATL